MPDEYAKIEGEEIVIRIPISAIPEAVQVAFDHAYGFERHDFAVANAEVFAREILAELNSEQEDGTTPIDLLLDAAACKAMENGAEGLSGGVKEDSNA